MSMSTVHTRTHKKPPCFFNELLNVELVLRLSRGKPKFMHLQPVLGIEI